MREKEKKKIKFFLFWHFQVMQTSDMSHGGGEVTNTKLWYYWFHSSHFSVVHLFIYLFIIHWFIRIIIQLLLYVTSILGKVKSIFFKRKDIVVVCSCFQSMSNIGGFSSRFYEASEISKGVQLLIFARPMVDSSWSTLRENRFWLRNKSYVVG